jgi:hypothetical protein
MSCNCKSLKKKDDINPEFLANSVTISVNWKIKLFSIALFILMSPVLIIKYALSKWKKVTE